MKVFYFTGTGNSLYVAKRIGGESYSIPKALKEGMKDCEDEQIGIVFPSYHNCAPRIVEKFLKQVTLNSKYIFAVITYGGLAGATRSNLIDIGKENGIQFSYIQEIKMVDNYLPLYDIRKELANQHKKKIEEHLKQIVTDVAQFRKQVQRPTLIENGIKRVVSGMYDQSFEKRFSVDDQCNGCKLCEKVCPVDNITVETKPVYQNHCEHCLACIHHCPQKAIHIQKEKNKVRFINEHVTIGEIIEANN